MILPTNQFPLSLSLRAIVTNSPILASGTTVFDQLAGHAVINSKAGYIPTEEMGELNYRIKPLNEYVK